MISFNRCWLLCLGMILQHSVFAQFNLVSTDPEPRNALIEQFGGPMCGYCPGGDDSVRVLVNAHPGRVFWINNYASAFGTVPAGFRTLYIPEADTLVQLAGVVEWPVATVNRYFYSFRPYANAYEITRADYRQAADSILTQTGLSVVNIGMEADYDSVLMQWTVNVELYYTASDSVPNRFHLALVEDNVVSYQQNYDLPGGVDSTYVHPNVLRACPTHVNGEVLDTTVAGTFYSRQYIVPLDSGWVPEECHFVAFVTQDGYPHVHTAQRTLSPNEVVAVDPALPELSLRLWPQPFRESATLDFGRILPQAEVAIYDLQGRELRRLEVRQDHAVEIDGRDLPPGIYLLRVESPDGQVGVVRFQRF